MENLLSVLFSKFIMTCQTQTFQQLKQYLIQGQPVSLQKLPKQLIKQQFNNIALLLAKNIVTYSPSQKQISLSLSDVFLYERVAKFQRFSNQYLQKNVSSLIERFLENGLQNGFSFPVQYDSTKLKNLKLQQKQQNEQKNIKQQQGGKKKKKIQQSKNDTIVEKEKYDYAKLIYEYSSKVQEDQQQKHKKSKEKDKKAENKRKNSSQKKQPESKKQELYLINITELTVLLRYSKVIQLINAEFHSKQVEKMKLFDFYFLKNKDELIDSKKTQKIEEYIAQLFGPQGLLMFNIIKKFPYITDKQVFKHSLQDIQTTRSAINKLAQSGFVYFYNENSKTIVYKIVQWEKIVKKYIDSVSQAILNLYILIDKLSLLSSLKSKAKILQLQSQINRLDDILLLFGY